MQDRYNLKFKHTTSRARDTYGYNICTLYVDGVKRGRCNGGGYDMQGTSLGIFVESEFKDLLLTKINKKHYGLKFHNPNYKPSEECLKAESEDELTRLTGLARLRDMHKQSSKIPTATHTIPAIDGACGIRSVEMILESIGYQFRCIDWKSGVYTLEKQNELKKAV